LLDCELVILGLRLMMVDDACWLMVAWDGLLWGRQMSSHSIRRGEQRCWSARLMAPRSSKTVGEAQSVGVLLPRQKAAGPKLGNRGDSRCADAVAVLLVSIQENRM
jgi:hypothetical protein